jgi:uncharacterized repeat protein (TIGR02543 family)
VTVLDNSGNLALTGHVFTGWATSAGGTLAYTTGGAFQIASDMDFYPAWRDETPSGLTTYTVTFNGNGGTVAAGDGTRVASASAVTLGAIMPPDPARAGYTFAGWNTRADGSGTAFTAATPVTADITVYALWTQISNNTPGDGNGISTGNNNPPATPDPEDPTPVPVPDPDPPAETTPPAQAPGGTDPALPPAPNAPDSDLIPGDNGNFIEIGADGTPLGEWSWSELEQKWIFEEYPPTAMLPQTGAPYPAGIPAGLLLLLAFALAAMGAGILNRESRRKNTKA